MDHALTTAAGLHCPCAAGCIVHIYPYITPPAPLLTFPSFPLSIYQRPSSLQAEDTPKIRPPSTSRPCILTSQISLLVTSTLPFLPSIQPLSLSPSSSLLIHNNCSGLPRNQHITSIFSPGLLHSLIPPSPSCLILLLLTLHISHNTTHIRRYNSTKMSVHQTLLSLLVVFGYITAFMATWRSSSLQGNSSSSPCYPFLASAPSIQRGVRISNNGRGP